MSDLKSLFKSLSTYWMFAAIMVAGFLVWFFTRGQFSNDMLTEVDDQLIKHELKWEGRGREYAQYRVVMYGQDDKIYEAQYRIPATMVNVPCLIVLHMMDSTKAVFDLLNGVENSGDCAIAALNMGEYLKADNNGKFPTGNSELGEATRP